MTTEEHINQNQLFENTILSWRRYPLIQQCLRNLLDFSANPQNYTVQTAGLRTKQIPLNELPWKNLIGRSGNLYIALYFDVTTGTHLQAQQQYALRMQMKFDSRLVIDAAHGIRLGIAAISGEDPNDTHSRETLHSLGAGVVQNIALVPEKPVDLPVRRIINRLKNYTADTPLLKAVIFNGAGDNGIILPSDHP